MSSKLSPRPESIALLSAAGVSDGGNMGALQNIAGTSLIDWQISTLQKCGVETFLIEVDSVPGELLNVADRLRNGGVRAEFVRSAKDLQSYLNPTAKLVVLAEAHYFSAPVLAELMQRSPQFIATIDGRDENAAFERIDLNTRWAGFAQLEAATARSLMELPEGWSIASSLLRHAIQSGVKFLPVAQDKLQSGDIARICDQTGADTLVERMLADRIGGATGLIERHIFGPIAKRAAPYIWASHVGATAVQVSAFVGAVASLGCGGAGWSIAAAATALVALFLHTLAGVTGGLLDAERHRSQRWSFWGLLVASALAAAWTNIGYGPDAAAFMAISIGLIVASYRIRLPIWSAMLLQSPALLAITMLMAAGLSVFALAAKIVALVQLGVLIAGLYLPAAKGKNSNQA
jgi:hypothetical protein